MPDFTLVDSLSLDSSACSASILALSAAFSDIVPVLYASVPVLYATLRHGTLRASRGGSSGHG